MDTKIDPKPTFGHSKAAEHLAHATGRRVATVVNQLDGDDEDLERIIDEDKWLRNWTRSMCELAGEEPGTEEFERCRRRMANQVLESATQGATQSGCGACGSSRVSLPSAENLAGRLSSFLRS